MLKEAVDDELLSKNPAHGVKPFPKNDSMQRKPFKSSEVKLLIKKAADPKWYDLIFSQKAATPRLRLDRSQDWPGMILFGYYIGNRISDIAYLTWENIDLSRGLATFVPSKTKKKLKFYQVPLHPSLIQWLKGRLGEQRPSGPVFPTLFQTSTSGKCGLSSQFNTIMDYAKVDRMLVRPASNGIRALYARSFHSLRHTSNSALAKANVSQELRMKIIGHQSQEVNMDYTHHEIETMRAAINKLPKL
jgi:integrase